MGTERQIRQEARESEKKYIKHTVYKTVNSTKPTNRGLQTITNASLCVKANNATTNARNKTRYKKTGIGEREERRERLEGPNRNQLGRCKRREGSEKRWRGYGSRSLRSLTVLLLL